MLEKILLIDRPNNIRAKRTIKPQIGKTIQDDPSEQVSFCSLEGSTGRFLAARPAVLALLGDGLSLRNGMLALHDVLSVSPCHGLGLRSLLLCSRNGMSALRDVLSVSLGRGLGWRDDTLPLRGVALGLQYFATIPLGTGRGTRARQGSSPAPTVNVKRTAIPRGVAVGFWGVKGVVHNAPFGGQRVLLPVALDVDQRPLPARLRRKRKRRSLSGAYSGFICYLVPGRV